MDIAGSRRVRESNMYVRGIVHGCVATVFGAAVGGWISCEIARNPDSDVSSQNAPPSAEEEPDPNTGNRSVPVTFPP